MARKAAPLIKTWRPDADTRRRVLAASPELAHPRALDFPVGGTRLAGWHSQTDLVRQAWLFETLDTMRKIRIATDRDLVDMAVSIDRAMLDCVLDRAEMRPSHASLAAGYPFGHVRHASPKGELQAMLAVIRSEQSSRADIVDAWHRCSPYVSRVVIARSEEPITVRLQVQISALRAACELALASGVLDGRPSRMCERLAALRIRTVCTQLFSTVLTGFKGRQGGSPAIDGPFVQLARRIGQRYRVEFSDADLKNLRRELSTHPSWSGNGKPTGQV